MESRKDKVNQVIENAIQNINAAIDVNTIMGEPIIGKNGEYIVPFSKISFGVLAGGGEYGKASIFDKNLPYSAGNGAVVSVKPCGFLIKDSLTKTYKFVSTSETSYDKIIDKTSEFFENLRVEQ